MEPPHDDANCDMCFWRNNTRCNICDYEPPPCDRTRFRGERFVVRMTENRQAIFLCSGCDALHDAAGLERRIRELNMLSSVLLAGHRRFMSAFTDSQISTATVIHNPEDDYEAFEQVDAADPIDQALDFIPAPSAEFNYLLAAITSDPSLDPYPPGVISLDPN